MVEVLFFRPEKTKFLSTNFHQTMLNKKLLCTTALVASVLSFNASAKTQGNYVGLNLIRTESKATDTEYYQTRHRYDNFSFGVDYKYAFNFNNFFIAPGIFFDNNAHDNNYSLGDGDRASLNGKYNYGAKIDFGYDLTEKFSPFVTLGHSETRLSYSEYGPNVQSVKYDHTQEGLIYGLGFRYSLTDSVSLNAAYEITKFNGTKNFDDLVVGNDKVDSDYRVAKLGVAFNF